MIATKPNNRRFYWLAAVLAIVLLFISLVSYIGWKIAGSNAGIAGGKPGFAVVGELPDTKMRTMEQWCTGVVKTSSDVWLVGRTEDTVREQISGIPADATDLGSSSKTGARGLFSRRRNLTTISRLQDDGTFQVQATIPDIACLVVSPDSETLYLFTWLSRPDTPVINDAHGKPVKQDMVFRSTDQGQNWEWIEAGFMTQATSMGGDLRPTFASDQDVWLWGKAPDRYSPSRYDTPQALAENDAKVATTLFYSPDAGQTSTRIYSPEALEASEELLLSMVAEPEGGSVQRFSHDTKRFVAQVDDTRAYAWTSDLAWYRDKNDDAFRLTMTSRAELVRASLQEPWEIKRVLRLPHTRLDHVTTAADGQTHAVLLNHEGEWLVRLDDESGEWVDPRATPTLLPRWLAGDQMNVRYFWSNGKYQVISLWGDIEVPRILFPFTEEPASINTDGHFYTDDGGRNWHQLAIPGYLGVMGLARHDAQLFWTKGNWYSNNEPQVWRYDLAQ